MAACSIDTAIRNIIAIGGTLDHLALLDNFCWCSSEDEFRLAQLKDAAQACYDYATMYGTPYISGKDSMFNDFKGFDKNGNPIKISVPPTLLISSLGVMKDITKAVSLDPKFEGDLVYIIGETKNELGAGEYFAHMSKEIGTSVPKVDAEEAINIYRKFEEAVDKRLISSALSPVYGGLGITLAKKTIAGDLGMEIDLKKVARTSDISRDDYLLFSESQTRFVVTVDPERKAEFEKIIDGVVFAEIGVITKEKDFVVKGLNGSDLIKTSIGNLDEAYKKTFKGW